MKSAQTRGKAVDGQGRCVHYGLETDIVSIRFPCCDGFWPCHKCHSEEAGHAARVWPRASFWEEAVLCGACGHTMAIETYLHCEDRCPRCQSAFNPECRGHRDFYFEP